MLRALTIILVVIGLAFVVWSYLVMTGGSDWLTARLTAEPPSKTETAAAPDATDGKAKTAKKEQTPVAEPGPGDLAKVEEETSVTGTDADAEPDADAKETTAVAEAETDTAPASGSEKKGGGEDADGDGTATADSGASPLETAKAAEKGSLTNPYADDYEAVAEEGHKKYMAAGCNGCHGGTGGGGMGPPLTNPIWVYGNDGDTLFRLIALGSQGLQEQGYTRKGSENVVGPMPPMGTIVKSNDDLWKIIAWIWSVNPPDKAASAAE